MIIMICYDLLKYSCIEMMKTILSKGLMIIEKSSVNLCALSASLVKNERCYEEGDFALSGCK